MSGVFMYKCLKEPTTDIFQCYFQTNRDVQGRNTRNAHALNVPFARLDIRKFNMRIHGAVIWNALPSFVCNSASLILFKQRLRNYLIESKLSAWLYNETCIETTEFFGLSRQVVFHGRQDKQNSLKDDAVEIAQFMCCSKNSLPH